MARIELARCPVSETGGQPLAHTQKMVGMVGIEPTRYPVSKAGGSPFAHIPMVRIPRIELGFTAFQTVTKTTLVQSAKLGGPVVIPPSFRCAALRGLTMVDREGVEPFKTASLQEKPATRCPAQNGVKGESRTP